MSLLDLLTVRSVDEILDGETLPAMRGNGLNVTAWAPLDPWRILSYAVSKLRQGVDAGQAAWAAAGFGDYVFGFVGVPGGIDVTSWAGLRAKNWFGVTPIGATYTKRAILLTNTAAGAYGPLAQGRMIVKFPGGGPDDRYIQDDDAVTIPGAGSISAVFRSEFPVDTANGYAYRQTPSTPGIVMVNANFPGVTATNPPATHTDPFESGTGFGTLNITGTPTGSHDFIVRIDSDGLAGVATWSIKIDAVAYDSQGSALSSGANYGGSGMDIFLNDSTGTHPFVAGDLYYFSTPGTDVTQPGRDAETAQQLGARCYAILPSFGFAKDGAGNWIPFEPTSNAVAAITRSLSDQVAIVLVRNSTTVNDVVKIVIAGQGLLLPTATLSAVQAYWTLFGGSTGIYQVSAPSQLAITLDSATVKARATTIAQSKAAAQKAVAAYLTGVDPKNRLNIGDGVAVIDRSYVMSLIRTAAGVTHLDDGLLINTYATDLTLPLDTLATYAGDVATSLTWIGS